jgi:short-subunit dehydrogenase
MTARRVLVLGATSAIAEAYARRCAARGMALTLVGRRADALAAIAADLTARGAAAADVCVADLDDVGRAEADFARMLQPGAPDEVLLAYGVLGDQATAQADSTETARLIHTNFVSAAVWLQLAARDLRHGPDARIIAIGSVAGDRGRMSNYVYGSAKAGLATFVEGMAHRLAASGTKVISIKPGFVDTPMTAHIAKGGPLWATPDQIAADIQRAAAKGQAVRYTPWFWRWIMLVITSVPRFVFHKTKL